MRSFTDNLGRVWTLAVNVAAVKKVRALCGLDLASVVREGKDGRPDASVLDLLASDPVLLVDVLYALCKDEADAKQVSDEQFGVAMAGDAVAKATEALLDEIVDFFPQPRRTILRRLVETARLVSAKAAERIDKALQDPALEKRIEEALSASPTNSPES